MGRETDREIDREMDGEMDSKIGRDIYSQNKTVRSDERTSLEDRCTYIRLVEVPRW
jgi:hypothetical protein